MYIEDLCSSTIPCTIRARKIILDSAELQINEEFFGIYSQYAHWIYAFKEHLEEYYNTILAIPRVKNSMKGTIFSAVMPYTDSKKRPAEFVIRIMPKEKTIQTDIYRDSNYELADVSVKDSGRAIVESFFDKINAN